MKLKHMKGNLFRNKFSCAALAATVDANFCRPLSIASFNQQKINQVWCLVQYRGYTCKLFLVVPSYRNESAVQVTLNYKLEIACFDDFSV